MQVTKHIHALKIPFTIPVSPTLTSVMYLQHIHAVVFYDNQSQQDIMELCSKVVTELALPPAAINPLVAKAFVSSFTAH